MSVDKNDVLQEHGGKGDTEKMAENTGGGQGEGCEGGSAKNNEVNLT